MKKPARLTQVLSIALCALLLVPGIASAMTWAEFVDTVHTGVQGGTYAFDMDGAEIDGPTDGTVLEIGSAAPPSQVVTISNATFVGGMVISNGNYALENVTVNNDAGDGILIVDSKDPLSTRTDVSLSLDAQSAIGETPSGDAAPVSGSGIHANVTHGGSIEIDNAAAINATAGSGGQSGIYVQMSETDALPDDCDVTVANTGAISLENSAYGANTPSGISVNVQGAGNSEVAVDNNASISTAGTSNGIQINQRMAGEASARVDNRAGGDIASATGINVQAHGATVADVTVNNWGALRESESASFGTGINASANSREGSTAVAVTNHGTGTIDVSGIGINAYTSAHVDSDVSVTNDARIDAGSYGIQLQSNAMQQNGAYERATGSATAEVVNTGDITSHSPGYGVAINSSAWVMSPGDATNTVTNSGALNAASGIYANSVAQDGNSAAAVVNNGAINATSIGILAGAQNDHPMFGPPGSGNASASVTNGSGGTIVSGGNGIFATASAHTGDASASLSNAETVTAQEIGAGLNVATQGASSVRAENQSAVSGGSLGLSLGIRKDTAITVTGGGYQGGAFEGPATHTVYDPADIRVSVRYDEGDPALASTAETEKSLNEIAENSGLTTLQDGTLVMDSYYLSGTDPWLIVQVPTHDMLIETVGPKPAPVRSEPVFEAVASAPAPVKVVSRPSFRGITYSAEWLYQAWFGYSRNVRVFELLTDKDGLPEKGEHQPFKERLGPGADGKIQLTLNVRTTLEGSLLTSLSMDMLEWLVLRDITTLAVVNKDTTDTYPLVTILEGLKEKGQGDCREVYLSGMDGKAVVIDRDGKKAEVE